MMSATSAPHRRWSSRSLGSQPSLQAFVCFNSQRIMPAADPIVPLTRCTRSAPSSPLATGSIASTGKRARSISSRFVSRASPCACCEPCSALRLSSSIVRVMDAIVWSFSTTFNRAASSASRRALLRISSTDALTRCSIVSSSSRFCCSRTRSFLSISAWACWASASLMSFVASAVRSSSTSCAFACNSAAADSCAFLASVAFIRPSSAYSRALTSSSKCSLAAASPCCSLRRISAFVAISASLVASCS